MDRIMAELPDLTTFGKRTTSDYEVNIIQNHQLAVLKILNNDTRKRFDWITTHFTSFLTKSDLEGQHYYSFLCPVTL
jgi:hypothetical protein